MGGGLNENMFAHYKYALGCIPNCNITVQVCPEPWLLFISIAKLRLSSHQLNIETGKHRDIAHSERKCNLCNTEDLEDEYHFSLICPVYNELRKVYIQI